MITNWLSSVLYLLTFFRFTLIWLDLNILVFGLPSGSIVGSCAFGLSIFAIIFNVVVCTLETRAKKRTKALPPAKLWIVALDLIFALCYVAAFVFELITAQAIEWNSSEYYTLHGFSIFAAQTYAGVLVAWHYHFFFAFVSLHSWRQNRSGRKAQRNTETRMERAEEMIPPVQSSTVTGPTKMMPQ